MKCLNCNADVAQTAGKKPKLYCNDRCKKMFQRRMKAIQNETMDEIGTGISGQNHTGTTISGQGITDAEWADIKAQGVRLTPDYVMTDFERANYRPASELGPGEFNPVSKPGDSHYQGYIDIKTLAAVDKACGDMLSHGIRENTKDG